MGSKVKITFVCSHKWSGAYGFDVFHSAGYFLKYPLVQVNGSRVQLWRNSWEQAGFGRGRFGYGSFGWAQGGLTSGGFGYGRFGAGEFGYYNQVVEWVTPQTFDDGRHTFGVRLYKANDLMGDEIPLCRVMIASTPNDPKALRFKSMSDETLTLAWV
jgi:hypothetical protein